MADATPEVPPPVEDAPKKTERVKAKGGRYYTKPAVILHPLASLLSLPGDLWKATLANNGKGPSVTTVLGAIAKPALIGWAAKTERKMIARLAANLYHRLSTLTDEPVPREKFEEMLLDEAGKGAHRQLLEEAANVGSQVHARIEWEIKGELGKPRADVAPLLASEQANRSFLRWKEWREQVQLKVVGTEDKLYSQIFGFGGTYDLLAYVSGVLTLLDFKTGKKVYAEAFLQNYAYRMALIEQGVDVKAGLIVRLPKYENDPEFDAVPVPEDRHLEVVFLAAKVVYMWWIDNEHKVR